MFAEIEIPEGWSYLWQDNAVYVSKDGGPWVLFMYFPPSEAQ